MTLADRIAIMNKGKIQQLGTPDEVYNDPNHIFVASFIGSPPMNLIKGSLANGTFIGPNTQVNNLGKGTNKNVVLGIRPEDMEIGPAKGSNLVSKLYSLEPTGDLTLMTAWACEQLVVAKGHRIFRQNIDTPIAFTFLKDRIYRLTVRREKDCGIERQAVCQKINTQDLPSNELPGGAHCATTSDANSPVT